MRREVLDGHARTRGSAGGRPPAFDPRHPPTALRLECGGINQLTHHRAVACRYDKLAVRYETTVHVATIETWLRDLNKINS